MKNTLVLLIAVFLSSHLNAQNRINVEYNQIFNTDFPVIRTGILQADDNSAVFVDLMKSKRSLKKDTDANISYLDFIKGDNSAEIKNGEKIVVQVGGNYDTYYLYNKKDSSFLFTDELGGQQFLIKDPFELKWELTKETKNISGYQCYKGYSSTSYRLMPRYVLLSAKYRFSL